MSIHQYLPNSEYAEYPIDIHYLVFQSSHHVCPNWEQQAIVRHYSLDMKQHIYSMRAT